MLIFSALYDFIVNIYRYREYLLQSVARDLRKRYQGSVLGYFWTILHPLGILTILTLVFSKIMNIGIKDYAIFLFPGVLTWNYFNSTLMLSLMSIRNNAKLLNQVPVPKFLFVISYALSNLINYFFSLLPLIIIMKFMGHQLSIYIFALPLLLFPLLLVTIGISLFLANCAVFFDDTLHITEVALQALYFLCPILYYREALPSEIIPYLILNPLFTQIEFIRGVFYQGVMPDVSIYLGNCLLSFVFLLTGLLIFKINENKFLYFI
ncbi:MAG: ABC transporter permease [Proteobacteria bacterium]|nr:ABC transporter permease [Pseudomonadota bacterium]